MEGRYVISKFPWGRLTDGKKVANKRQFISNVPGFFELMETSWLKWWKHREKMLVENDVTFCNDRFGGGGSGACSAGNCLNYGWLKRNFLYFEVTLEQNIKVLNDIILQRTSSLWTIILVQMKLDFNFAFYFNKVWENIDPVVL